MGRGSSALTILGRIPLKLNGKLKAFIGVAAFAFFIGAAAFAYNILSEKTLPQIEIEQGKAEVQADSSKPEAEKIKAPDFTVQDIDGNSVKLSDMLGTPVVLNFWASWCPPCKSEMPEFNKVWNELGSDVAFMMVDLVDGQRETTAKGLEYVTEQGFSFPVYFDAEQEAAYAYGITSIPTTLFIDGEGYIAAGVQGAIDEQTLRKGVELII